LRLATRDFTQNPELRTPNYASPWRLLAMTQSALGTRQSTIIAPHSPIPSLPHSRSPFPVPCSP